MKLVVRLSVLILLSGATSCLDVKESEEYKKVLFDRDSLIENIEEKDEELRSFAKEFDQIERNLSAIDSNKARLIRMSAQGKISQRELIHSMISDIYIALDQNQAAIRRLENGTQPKSGSAGLSAIVSTLKHNLFLKEEEIELLKSELASMELEVRNLKDAVEFKEKLLAQRDTLLARQGAQLQKQEQLIRQKEAEMVRAYYFRGTTAELVKAGIIRKEGGIAGLGSVKVLGEKLGGDKMRVLNIKTDKMLLVGRYRKKKVISNHPYDSYFFLAKDGQIYLKVSNPERFWSVSKYLVVAVE